MYLVEMYDFGSDVRLGLKVRRPRRVRQHVLRMRHTATNTARNDKPNVKFTVWEHTYTHLTAPFSGTTRASRYQKSKTKLDFPEARDSEWQWHQLCYMQVCTSLQTDNHASTSPLSFLQAGCPSCRLTDSVKALKFTVWEIIVNSL